MGFCTTCTIQKPISEGSKIKPDDLDTNSKKFGPSKVVDFNVYYHIVRKSSGLEGFDPSQLDEITKTLNKSLNEHNIFVTSIGFDYIDDSTYHVLKVCSYPRNFFHELIKINKEPNAINIYIVSDLVEFKGIADYYSPALVVSSKYATTYVVSHEMGHCLALLHTFQNNDRSGKQICWDKNDSVYQKHKELKDGSNCSTHGDLVCDTPADANIGEKWGYKPDKYNLMLYYAETARSFTKGQAVRMKIAFEAFPHLSRVIKAKLPSKKKTNPKK